MGWGDVAYTVTREHSDDRVRRLVEAVSELYQNGGALLLRASAKSPLAFDDALRNHLDGLVPLANAVLDRDEIESALPEMRLRERIRVPFPFRLVGRFELEGALMDRLTMGGAYTGGYDEEEARQICRDFVSGILVGKNSCILWSTTAWSSWFHDISWDSSFLLRDDIHRMWWIFAATDVD